MKPSLLLLPLVLLALGACNSNRQATGETSSLGFPAPDQELVYHTALSVLARYGHSPDMEQSSTTTGTIVTRWKNSLQPFSGKGYREKITVYIHPVPGRDNYFMTDTRVVRQTNKNMTDPSNVLAAEWSGEERNAEMEALINGQIEVTFLPGSLSPEFRQRHGLAPAPR